MTFSSQTIGSLEFDAFIAAYGEKDVRYEMYDGDVFSMSGGSENHSLITVSALIALRLRARPRGCQTHGPDLYVRSEADNRSAMSPDVYVRCGPPIPSGQYYANDPLVIVDVLSPSTVFNTSFCYIKTSTVPKCGHVRQRGLPRQTLKAICFGLMSSQTGWRQV